MGAKITNLSTDEQAVVWDDLRTPSNIAKALAGKEAKEIVYQNGIVMSFETGTTEGIAFNLQMPHSYKEGSDIEFHVHEILPTAGNGNVKWDFTYAWSNIGDAIPNYTTISKTIDMSTRVADTHYLEEIEDAIDGTGKLISSMLICTLTRDTTVASNYDDDVYLMEVDIHFQKDALGSRFEALK